MRRMPGVKTSSLIVWAGLVFAVTGCGAQKITLPVSVVDESGAPIASAHVWVPGTNLSASTDATGNAQVSGFKPGVYKVYAGLDGYYENTYDVTIDSKASPSPIQVALPYLPPLGIWLHRASSTTWEILRIDTVSPLHATLRSVEWHCIFGNWSDTGQVDMQLDPSSNQLTGADSVQITGPKQINVASDPRVGWTPDPALTGLPDAASTIAPTGACTNGSATW
jgi:hypothetical protein